MRSRSSNGCQEVFSAAVVTSDGSFSDPTRETLPPSVDTRSRLNPVTQLLPL